ncbi:hypothetical protein GCM10022254_05300 [Actinomadura meridiana]|uniref:Uncharacterized protein n=1 Tax=Actinomadura meridiana TaxID=559626 RepID=A0ABP8BSJ6_9ACTN
MGQHGGKGNKDGKSSDSNTPQGGGHGGKGDGTKGNPSDGKR